MVRISTLLVAFGILLQQSTRVHANAIPSDEALRAKTAEEFIAAEKKAQMAKRSLRKLNDLEVSLPILADAFGGVSGFYHGVASGDPLPDRVILWTRYTPQAATDTIQLELRIAEVDPSVPLDSLLDVDANENIKVAEVEVDVSSDFIAKIDVIGLKSNTHYVFAFTDGSTAVSDVGQTRTAPGVDDDVEEMTYALFSCSNFGNGYFHSYDVASSMKDIDFWVHVGDYIYEYGLYSSYASDAPERKAQILPEWETVDLQDYRNRYASYHQGDEGLRNLRRRAPVIQIWDDHELANNAYGEGNSFNTGAENHQVICSADRSSSDQEKAAAQCDRDEGNPSTRFNDAARAFMEWIPVRRGLGNMGVVDITSINQVIEWGNLASIVAVDTRITDRSKEPTLANVFAEFVLYSQANKNISAYYDEESEVRQTFDSIAADVQADMNNPEFTMIGDESVDFVLNAFENSKAAGKPWQIFAGGTMMGPQLLPNVDKLSEYVPSDVAPLVKEFTDELLLAPSSFLFLATVAMEITKTPYNRDGFDGFAVERAKLINGFMEKANNPIVLGGDLHDSWAWTLYDGGKMDGEPAAVNIGCPGVTSPGVGSLAAAFAPLGEITGGGMESVFKIIHDAFIGDNKGLKHANVEKKGFVAMKATKESHTAEYILFDPDTTLSDFETARDASGKITADYVCDASLVTTAGEPGSLVQQSDCIIEFDDSRPAEWDIPVPITDEISGDFLFTGCGYNSCELDFSSNCFPDQPALSERECSELRTNRSCRVNGCVWNKPSQLCETCNVITGKNLCFKKNCNWVKF